MLFNVATCLKLAFVVFSSVGVQAKRELLTRLVKAGASGPTIVDDLNIVKMPCEGIAAGYTQSCVRPDGKWWGCKDGLICVMKSHKFGKCLKLIDAIPRDSEEWLKKNKGVVCASRNPKESPIDEHAKAHAPDDGNSCSKADYGKGCECAGAQWRCADACNLKAKACDVGFSCLRKTNNAYAICATQEMIDRRGQTDIYDPIPVPCGENVGTWKIRPGSKPFVAGPMTGMHAQRCEAEKKKLMAKGHTGHQLLSWVQGVLGSSGDFWDDEPSWHQDFVASQIANGTDL